MAEGTNGKTWGAARGEAMTDQGQGAIRERLAELFAEAGLTLDDEAMDRMVALVAENRAAGARVRRLVGRYDEPAFALGPRRRG